VNEIALLSWPQIHAEAEARLKTLRTQNDSPDLDLGQTAALRGEIRALKWLLDLPKAVALKSQTPPPHPGGDYF